nr:immunoglobulin heavy chain junction region [Macaca mulatta]MOY22012.1 immunoglobulin heavy chain junction region [Macaca mulatta]MOY23028.1 immunoglobulin heavy chain junction region [Macaca mulatta]MOY26365.1 immunoglobulin heavy chain junction region [Macaca mulatta]MOY26836.1 immunoglobulin heavy chain junction region [Macaca mulatta]
CVRDSVKLGTVAIGGHNRFDVW